MKVKELIERLKKCNSGADVFVSDYETEIELWTSGADGVTFQNADKIYIEEVDDSDFNTSEFK